MVDANELFGRLINKYSRMYMKLARANGVPYDDAEDVVMDSFWCLYDSRYFEDLDEEHIKIVMACMVKNKAIDYYRKNGKRLERTSEIDLEEVKNVLRAKEGNPLDIIVSRERYEYICACIEEMRAALREPAIMYFIEEQTYNEIGERLGISGTACRSRIARARRSLNERLSNYKKNG